MEHSKNLYKITFNIFKRSTIYGIKFYGRGYDFSETEIPEDYKHSYGFNKSNEIHWKKPKNNFNILVNNWFEKTQYSSWCKIRYASDLNPERINTRPNSYTSTKYAQLNYFFRLYIIGDEHFHGVPFASVTARKLVNNRGSHKFISKISADDSISFDDAILFTACTNIISTPVLLIGIDRDSNPILIDNNKLVNKKMTTIRNKLCVQKEENNINEIILIDMQPSRSSLNYEKKMNHYYNQY